MGDVVSGKYPLSLSAWNWIIERNPILDFVPAIKDRQVLAVIPKPPELDVTLFIRPFTDDAWKGIGILILIGLFLLIVPYFFVKKYPDTAAYKIVMYSGWFFFVLINAFYGGALTMFFVSEIRLPFNSIKEVLQLFPKWKLIYQAGNDAYFDMPAAQVSSIDKVQDKTYHGIFYFSNDGYTTRIEHDINPAHKAR